MKTKKKNTNFIVFVVFFLSSPQFHLSLSPDGIALLSLKSAADPSSIFSTWNSSDATPCSWYGVTCATVSDSDQRRVVSLAIAGKNLRAYIPSELGALIYLRRLNLHNNRFYGAIPSAIFPASSLLHSVYLYGNNLSGNLPASLCDLPRLQNLDVSDNSLSGGIRLKNCVTLQRLILARNRFFGELPRGVFAEMGILVQLDLSSNEFTGSIPSDIGNLKSLTGTLNLSFNRLSGQIPESLAKLPVTVSFDLRNNRLSGEIPQTGVFANQGPTAFLNNPSLCGFPLKKSCKQSSTPWNFKPKSRQKGLSTEKIILISVADAIGVALIGFGIVYLYWRKKDSGSSCSCTRICKLGENEGGALRLCCLISQKKREELSEEESGKEEEGGGGKLVAIDKGFKLEVDELLRASAYVLGKSGLGIVYKVVLGSGIPVAVRRIGEGGDDRRRYKEFAAEIKSISRVKHPNIVRLRAYYWASDEKLLITDFISNGNLASALKGKNGQAIPNLKWSTRLQIAKGIARGLAYIHENSPKRMMVHGDIKPSNILLDPTFHPLISDLGLTRLIAISGTDPSSASGYIGAAFPYLTTKSNTSYRAPESRTASTSQPTQKSDVYSFGLVLLELLTGKSPDSAEVASSSNGAEGVDLVWWVRRGLGEECEMVEPIMAREMSGEDKKEALGVFRVAMDCTEADPEVRPRMKSVSETLDRIGSSSSSAS